MTKRQRLIRYARTATAGGVMQVLFPDIAQEHWEHIVWECTGYPCFWPTRDSIACFVAQLLNVRRAFDGKPHEPLDEFRRAPLLLNPGTRS